MSDFADREFHVGSLTGLRAFRADRLGRLVGPSQGGIFKPGINEAECKTDPFVEQMAALNASLERQMREMSRIMGESASGRRSRRKPQPPPSPSQQAVKSLEHAKPKHVTAGLGCQCGFYAYYDGMNDYLKTGRIAAVVEGFGTYTLGTRGFRTSKARLVALVTPEMGRSQVNTLSLTFTTYTTPRYESMTPLLWSYIQRNYPDVPVYDTQDEATAAHPLYQPEVPTPDDEDFWTRPAVTS